MSQKEYDTNKPQFEREWTADPVIQQLDIATNKSQ